MTARQTSPARPLFLGIECGATRTTVAIAADEPTIYWRGEFGPANLRLLTDAQLTRHLQAVARSLPKPAAIAIAMAGSRTKADRERIQRAAAKVWPGVPCCATNDLETALLAAEETHASGTPAAGPRSSPTATRNTQHATRNTRHAPAPLPSARILVLSGTGSCCYGRSRDGQTAKIGGWGHILGDKGSGFEIGLRALKAVVYYFDRDGEWSELGRRILRKLQLNEPDDLIGWVQSARKEDVAAIAVEVFNGWSNGDAIAADILEGAAHGLAADAISCARRLANKHEAVHFVLAGGVLLNQARFAKKIARLLRQSWPAGVVTPLERESVWGAVELAKRQFRISRSKPRAAAQNAVAIPRAPRGVELPSIESLKLSPTEQRNPRSMKLDRLSVAEAIVLMLSEDLKIPTAIMAERKKIGRAVTLIARAFNRGGRLFYVGAGTSGRLGVLDASECPPTFSVPPDLVQGIMAGGQRALWESIEGAEDDSGAGARAIQFRGVGRWDVVVGIAASGRTPFVWGALWEAKRRSARTIMLCFNPSLAMPRRHRPDLVIAPNVGPELLTGSTRLKSGTATKLVLNVFTTLAMVRTGKVISNLMVDVNPSNVKLRDRAVRILSELSGVSPAVARVELEKSGWVVKEALRRARHPK